MKQLRNGLLILAVLVFLISCVSAHPGRYNTQRGAAIGAGLGALCRTLHAAVRNQPRDRLVGTCRRTIG